MNEPITPLTDAQLAAIAERAEKYPRGLGDYAFWAGGDRRALLASHAALAARLAEAERIASLCEDRLVMAERQRADLRTDLAAAQATIERLKEVIRWAANEGSSCVWCGGSNQGDARHRPDCALSQILAPEADDA